MSDRWVESLKVVELREELKKRGLSTTGVKAVLAERLSTALKEIAEADQGAKADDPGSSDAADAEEDNGEKQPDSGVQTTKPAGEEPPAAEEEPPAAAVDAAPKPMDVEEPKKPEPKPQPAAPPAALISPRADPMEEPMTVNSLLDEAGEGDGTEQQDDLDNAEQDAEPEPSAEAPKAPAEPAPAAPAEPERVAAKRPAPQAEDAGKGEDGKADDGKSEKKNKRQPIQFQPPERKQSASKPAAVDDPVQESPKPATPRASSQPASASKAEPAAAVAAAAAPPPAEAAAKEPPAQQLPVAKRLKVDTTHASPAEQGSTPSAPLTAEAERTRALYIAGLVRPFTEPALRQLLSKTGTLEELWLPPLKTHAIAIFETEEQAEATRQAIYLLKWPLGSAKVLQPKFVTLADAEKEKVLAGGPASGTLFARGGVIAALKASQQAARAGPAGSNNSTAVAAAAAAAADVARAKAEAKDGATAAAAAAQKELGGERGAEDELVEDEGRVKSEGASVDGNNAKPAPAPVAMEEEEEEKILRLEDLFRKTTSKPQLYYLPLTEEQVGEKKRKAAEQVLPGAASAEQPVKEREGGAGESRKYGEQRSRERERRRSRSREHPSRR